VAALPVESKVRHRSPYPGDKSKFRWSDFKSLSTAEDMHRYAHQRLEALGRGSSRAVYAVSSGKVLKIAASFHGEGSSDAGIAQNRAEVDVYTDSRTKPVVAAVYDADPDYRWILSEAVRALSSPGEFQSITGSDIMSAVSAASAVHDGSMTVREAVEAFSHEADDDYPAARVDRKTVKMIVELLDIGLQSGDLEDHYHWGKTSGGRLVLLDYGFTTGVYEEFYKENTTGSGGEPDGGQDDR